MPSDEGRALATNQGSPAGSSRSSRSSIHGYPDDESCTEERHSDAARRHHCRQVRKKHAVRAVSLLSATVAALCAGSIVVYSLYAPSFQSRLHYSQFQVNGVAIGGSLALYLPVSVMGYVCDRVGVAPLALLSAVLFGAGYGLAAVVYQKVDFQYSGLSGGGENFDGRWSYPLMVFAFVLIGAGTCAMYISSVSTCAKNFGKGRYRGIALAMPITGFGLSGMWLSQAGNFFFAEHRPDGSFGEVDVFRFFIFLAILLFVVGIVCTFSLRVVDEQDLIDEAIEEMEHSGLLDGRSLLGHRSVHDYGTASHPPTSTYGGLPEMAPASAGDGDDNGDDDHDQVDYYAEPSKDEDERWKKNFVLNAETRTFLTDHTMWLFAIAFLLVIGPGEAFINNLGTVIGTLSPPPRASGSDAGSGTSAATHVSIFGVTSTIARLLVGLLTDLLAPSPHTQHVQLAADHGPGGSAPGPQRRCCALSRVAFMLFFSVLMAAGLLVLASGAVQNHADRFWIVSGLVGAGYGAVFSVAPLIVTIIWGVENFATNFGIVAMLPAIGSTFWGLLYSAVYQAGARKPPSSTPSHEPSAGDAEDDLFCYGRRCYASTFWAEGVTALAACLFLFLAWKGKRGWQQRGVVI